MKYSIDDEEAGVIDWGEAVRKRTRKPGSPITFRPTDEVDELLTAALEATGSDQTELILQCIRDELPNVVQKILERQLKRAARFDALTKRSKGKAGEV